MFTEQIVAQMGLGRLTEYLGLETPEELHQWMVETRLLTLEDIAEWLNDTNATICPCCNDGYADSVAGVCEQCLTELTLDDTY